MLNASQPRIAEAVVPDVIRISQDRIALLLAVGTTLIAFATLCAIFGKAIARDFPVEVVDRDGSKVSASFAEAIRSAPESR